MRNMPELPDNKASTVKGLTGQSSRHESAHKHVSGEAIYVDDQLAPENTLHAYVGLSTVARATVKSLDLTKVAAAEGVISVLTLVDIPGHTDIGPIFPGDPLMVNQGDEVEFYGQVLFAVAAETHLLARKAARLALVEYEELDADVTIEQGLANKSFVRPSHAQSRGDTVTALSQASNQ